MKCINTNEEAITYPYDVTIGMLNKDGIMKPYCYQLIMSDVAERHLKNINLSIGDLSKYGMAWVIISSSFEIKQPVKGAIRLIGHTWHSEQKGMTFRRDFSFADEEGNVIFNAATFSVLFDLNNRKILHPNKFPLDLSNPTKKFTMEASSHIRNKADMSPCDRRRIYPSQIDSIGHTNNCHYSEFVYDAFNDAELDNIANLARLDLYFLSELRLGDCFTVRRGFEKDGTLIIDGINEGSGKESFACKLIFKK